jgi:hypothetical protein
MVSPTETACTQIGRFPQRQVAYGKGSKTFGKLPAVSLDER